MVRSKDGLVRRVVIRYFNTGEDRARTTDRAVRSVVKLFDLDHTTWKDDMQVVQAMIDALEQNVPATPTVPSLRLIRDNDGDFKVVPPPMAPTQGEGLVAVPRPPVGAPKPNLHQVSVSVDDENLPASDLLTAGQDVPEVCDAVQHQDDAGNPSGLPPVVLQPVLQPALAPSGPGLVPSDLAPSGPGLVPSDLAPSSLAPSALAPSAPPSRACSCCCPSHCHLTPHTRSPVTPSSIHSPQTSFPFLSLPSVTTSVMMNIPVSADQDLEDYLLALDVDFDL